MKCKSCLPAEVYHCGEQPIHCNVIREPNYGTVVLYLGDFLENKKDKPVPVYILGGKYEIDGRISNFWSWRVVLKDGSLGEEQCGYGNFKTIEHEVHGKFRVRNGERLETDIKVTFPKPPKLSRG